MRGDMEYLTTSEAAKLAGVSPSKIKNWAGSGKLSCHKDENGYRLFDPAEVARVFDVKMSDSRPESTPESRPQSTVSDQLTALHEAEKTALQAQIDALKERLKDRDETVTELRDQRDKWEQMASRSTLLLENHQKEEPAPEPEPAKKGLLARLFG